MMTMRRNNRSRPVRAIVDTGSHRRPSYTGEPSRRAVERRHQGATAEPLTPCDLLVVQRNPLQAQLIAREALRTIPGLDVRVQRCRKETILELDSLTRPPGLVLLDPYLPDGDGLDVLREIRSKIHVSTAPVVVTARTSDDPAIERAMRAYANAALVVHDDLLPFTDALRYLVRYWFCVHAQPRPSSRRDTGAQVLEIT